MRKEHHPRDPADSNQCTPEEQHVSSLPTSHPTKTLASLPLNTWMPFQRKEQEKSRGEPQTGRRVGGGTGITASE